ncbi:MAG: rhomboid family intramembrane serine protease [Acidimicrobiia bacterium]|jgi:membrane associated rhomboid family serine protease
MLPIRDVNPTRIRPWVTWALIAACVAVYFGYQDHATPNDEVEFLYRRAAIACEITTGQPLSAEEIVQGACSAAPGPPVFVDKRPWLSVLTSMFLHGGLAHLLFNMWSLWIFGNNVEEAFGHFQYALLYLIGGVVATLVFVLANPDSTVPLIGASGAIASVLGSYAVLFPTHRVLTLLGWFLLPLPAVVFLGFWFFAQFGLGGTNTAWEAHVGGFVFGLAIAALFRRRLLKRVAVLP